MRKFISLLVLIVFLSVIGLSFTAQGGCTICETSSEECHRVIIGNTVHVFYGDEKPCENIEEPQSID